MVANTASATSVKLKLLPNFKFMKRKETNHKIELIFSNSLLESKLGYSIFLSSMIRTVLISDIAHDKNLIRKCKLILILRLNTQLIHYEVSVKECIGLQHSIKKKPISKI